VSSYSTRPATDRRTPIAGFTPEGCHNLFGHPAPTTIRSLHDAGARVYRTDRCGAITVTVDNGTTIDTILQQDCLTALPPLARRSLRTS
jgi:hypothetical protein